MKTIQTICSFSAIVALLLSSCEPKKETRVTIPSNIISVEKGIMMKQTYNNDIQKIIERNREDGKYEGTEFAWIDLDSLKNYIALLDKVSKLNNKKVSGIRIYFSEYPYNGSYSKDQMNRLLPGREGMFLAPTTAIPATENSRKNHILGHVPFSIASTGNDKLVGDFKVITRLLSKNEQSRRANLMSLKQADTATTTEQTSLLFNDLGMYPPPKNTTDN